MALLRPSGELDLATVEPFRREVQAVLDGQPDELVIDLCDVSFLDSSGLAVLAAALKSQRARDAGLVLTNPQPIVQRALVLVGLGTLIGAD
ncbi:MAG: anti-anti-sigma factor [Frankiales bacterium]|jgi:anti-sigma B factor antagonist|nr:anti-anti-sigma factor [Frankiales bacterium]MCW2709508.1 anti-anti-sigma factor [Frankiales bacterium]